MKTTLKSWKRFLGVLLAVVLVLPVGVPLYVPPIGAILAILVFGVWGSDYNATNFIYFQF